MTVNCNGTVTNQNAPDGYGTGQQSNDTINVQTGSVTGTGSGFNIGDNNTVNLSTGTSVTGGANGISENGTGTLTLSNNGTISGNGANSIVNGIVTAGSLSGTNSGTISAITTAVNGSAIAVNPSTNTNLTNASGAQIIATGNGGEAVGLQGNSVTLTNNGTMTVTGGTTQGSFGVFGLTSVAVTNSGTISADDAGGSVEAVGVVSNGTLNVINNAGGMIQGTGFNAVGVLGSGTTTVNNSGTISGAMDGVNSNGSTASITNAGTITGTTRQGIRVNTASITNNSGGTITGDMGIFFRANNAASTIFNAGTITGTGGTAIQFSANSVGNTLTLGPGFAINGTVIGIGSDILQLGGTGTGTFNVSTIGASQQYQGFTTFNKIDTSTWTLTGSGAQNWAISQGTLIGDTNSLQGSQLTNNAALVFDQSFAGTYAGVISGSGTVTKSGSGTVILSGTNTYNGATSVNAGLLVVNGSIANSATTVNNGGTLSGSGTVGRVTVASGGAFAPGPIGTPGTMTVAGNLAFQSGALYVVQVTPSTASRANATGTATLAGTVNALFASGSYTVKSYTILSAAGGRTGTFGTLTTSNLPAGFAANLSYTATDAILDLTATLGQTTLNTAGLNQNQQNVANGLNSFFNNGGALPPGFTGVFGLTGANLGNALTLLSGEVTTGAQTTSFQLMSQFLALMMDPFVDGRSGIGAGGGGPALGYAQEQETQRQSPSDASLAYASVMKAPVYKAHPIEARWNVWGTAFGAYNRTDGDPAIGSHDLIARTGGFAVGMDYRWWPGTTVGFALAGGATGWGLANGLGNGRSDAFQAGVYGTTRSGPTYLSLALAYTAQWDTIDRTSFALDRLTARFSPQGFGGRAESGYRYALPQLGGVAQLAVTPYAAVQAQTVHLPAFNEVDLTSGGFGLRFAARDPSDTRAEVGARFEDVTTLYSMPWILRARVAYAHDWIGDPSANAAFQLLGPGSGFIVNGATPVKDSALVSAGSELHVNQSLTLGAKFDSQLAQHSQTYAATGTVRLTW